MVNRKTWPASNTKQQQEEEEDSNRENQPEPALVHSCMDARVFQCSISSGALKSGGCCMWKDGGVAWLVSVCSWFFSLGELGWLGSALSRQW